ncbi:MAG TPA: biopolymer transporter ExbD [Verrucomicrobiae bacterium]|jgi:biopolymer transport protein ExbD|nr:biopolymer transporter ExbD [Verrucomicrobiae bacterium]
MQFTTRKRRGAPAVIIVSLIDVLIVVLIFLMVTTTFKQQAALKLILPKSNEPQTGATTEKEFIVSIPKSGPLYFNKDPVTTDKLKERMMAAVAANPDMTLIIRADTDAPWGLVVKVRDTANAAHIKTVNASVDSSGAP